MSRADRLLFISTCLQRKENTVITTSPREIETGVFGSFHHTHHPSRVTDTEINDWFLTPRQRLRVQQGEAFGTRTWVTTSKQIKTTHSPTPNQTTKSRSNPNRWQTGKVMRRRKTMMLAKKKEKTEQKRKWARSEWRRAEVLQLKSNYMFRMKTVH